MIRDRRDEAEARPGLRVFTICYCVSERRLRRVDAVGVAELRYLLTGAAAEPPVYYRSLLVDFAGDAASYSRRRPLGLPLLKSRCFRLLDLPPFMFKLPAVIERCRF